MSVQAVSDHVLLRSITHFALCDGMRWARARRKSNATSLNDSTFVESPHPAVDHLRQARRSDRSRLTFLEASRRGGLPHACEEGTHRSTRVPTHARNRTRLLHMPAREGFLSRLSTRPCRRPDCTRDRESFSPYRSRRWFRPVLESPRGSLSLRQGREAPLS